MTGVTTLDSHHMYKRATNRPFGMCATQSSKEPTNVPQSISRAECKLVARTTERSSANVLTLEPKSRTTQTICAHCQHWYVSIDACVCECAFSLCDSLSVSLSFGIRMCCVDQLHVYNVQCTCRVRTYWWSESAFCVSERVSYAD